jgi:urease subunit gamma/beta
MMNLTPTELERLTIFSAAELARKRRAKGLRLSYVEAIAYITDEVLEGAREGRSVAELVEWGGTLLTTDDVLPGVAALVPRIMVDGLFDDGTRLIAIYRPIRPGKLPAADECGTPGEVITPEGDIELNEGRATVTLEVTNSGDRAIQVASHFHFFEANKALAFDRARAFGMRLDVPAGNAVRFEPGDEKIVTLVELAGAREVYGLNALTEGPAGAPRRGESLKRAADGGFEGARG